MTLTPYVKVNHVAMVTSLSYIRYFYYLIILYISAQSSSFKMFSSNVSKVTSEKSLGLILALV